MVNHYVVSPVSFLACASRTLFKLFSRLCVYGTSSGAHVSVKATPHTPFSKAAFDTDDAVDRRVCPSPGKALRLPLYTKAVLDWVGSVAEGVVPLFGRVTWGTPFAREGHLSCVRAATVVSALPGRRTSLPAPRRSSHVSPVFGPSADGVLPLSVVLPLCLRDVVPRLPGTRTSLTPLARGYSRSERSGTSRV